MANPQISTPAKSRQEEQREGKGEREERGEGNHNIKPSKTPPYLQMAAGTAIDEFNTLVKLKNKR
jgi:hypothetical protein